jgi:hypothetical protein
MAYGKGVQLDHLVYAVRDLEQGIASIERLIGVRAATGGKHTGRGTHNALLSLGTGSYLEIIAGDPDQPAPADPRPFGIDRLREPRLVTWAVRVPDIEERVETARASGYDPGPIVPMSRALPGGGELKWRLTLPRVRAGDGLVPFLIDWEPGQHPSQTAPSGAMLVELQGEHPRPESVQPLLDAIGVDVSLVESARPALIATIEGPNGTVLLS